jgi:hypothetical protein
MATIVKNWTDSNPTEDASLCAGAPYGVLKDANTATPFYGLRHVKKEEGGEESLMALILFLGVFPSWIHVGSMQVA